MIPVHEQTLSKRHYYGNKVPDVGWLGRTGIAVDVGCWLCKEDQNPAFKLDYKSAFELD